MTAISRYMRAYQEKKRDGNAYLNIIVTHYKDETAKKIIDKSLKETKYSSELCFKGGLIKKLDENGTESRIIPQRIIDAGDNIWKLSLVTQNYYFYLMDSEPEECLMYITKLKVEMPTYSSQIARNAFLEELAAIHVGLIEPVYMSPETEDHLPDILDGIPNEIEEKRKVKEYNDNFLVGRFHFCDYYGLPKGVHHTDDIFRALEDASEFQCEILDKNAVDSPILYSVWDGWNRHSDHYEELRKIVDEKEAAQDSDEDLER